tara:strand:- start:413 stop:1003 length:591 start_codon:yes stop_codon:yes gene_type:complete
MATLNTTNIKHASSGSNNIVLASNGSVTIPTLTATNLTTNSSFGKILQVIQTFKTDGTSQAGNSSSTYYDISGMSVTITPSSSSNKVLVNWVAQVNSNSTDRNNSIRLLRDSTVIGNSTAGSSQNAQTDHRTTNDTNCHPFTMMYLDSPNTTSAVTYKLQWAIEGSGGNATGYYLNRDAYAAQGAVSHITVMEVAA